MMVKLSFDEEPFNERVEVSGAFIISVMGSKQRRTSYEIHGTRGDVKKSLMEFLTASAIHILEDWNTNNPHTPVGNLENAMDNDLIEIVFVEDETEVIGVDRNQPAKFTTFSVEYGKGKVPAQITRARHSPGGTPSVIRQSSVLSEAV